jgi:hypothetical protein
MTIGLASNLRSLRSINVVGIPLFVFALPILGHLFPFPTFLWGQGHPPLADNFRQNGLASLVRTLGLTFLAALASEKYEHILRTLDVVLVALLRPAFDEVTTARRFSSFMSWGCHGG